MDDIAGPRINYQIYNYINLIPEVTSGFLMEIILKVTPDPPTVADCG